jgi:hypothetical protein
MDFPAMIVETTVAALGQLSNYYSKGVVAARVWQVQYVSRGLVEEN